METKTFYFNSVVTKNPLSETVAKANEFVRQKCVSLLKLNAKTLNKIKMILVFVVITTTTLNVLM